VLKDVTAPEISILNHSEASWNYLSFFQNYVSLLLTNAKLILSPLQRKQQFPARFLSSLIHSISSVYRNEKCSRIIWKNSGRNEAIVSYPEDEGLTQTYQMYSAIIVFSSSESSSNSVKVDMAAARNTARELIQKIRTQFNAKIFKIRREKKTICLACSLARRATRSLHKTQNRNTGKMEKTMIKHCRNIFTGERHQFTICYLPPGSSLTYQATPQYFRSF
jgi:hypothetical protein